MKTRDREVRGWAVNHSTKFCLQRLQGPFFGDLLHRETEIQMQELRVDIPYSIRTQGYIFLRYTQEEVVFQYNRL